MAHVTFSIALGLVLSAASATASDTTYSKVQEIDLKGGQVYTVSLNPQGECLAAAITQNGSLTVLDICRTRILWAKTLADVLLQTQTMAWSSDGRLLAVSTKGKMTVFDSISSEVTKELVGHADSVFVSSAFSSDAKLLAVKDFKHDEVAVFDTASGSVVQAIPTPGNLVHIAIRTTPDDKLAFSPNDELVFVSGVRTLRGFRVSDGEKVREFTPDADMFSVSFSLDGRFAAYASAKPDVEGDAKVVNLESMKEVLSFDGLGNVYGGALRFSQNNEQLFWMSMKGPMQIWDLQERHVVLKTDNPEFTDPFGTLMMINSKMVLRFTFDMAPSHDFFITAHPGSSKLEVWKLP